MYIVIGVTVLMRRRGKKEKKNLKKELSAAFEMPEEIVSDLPLISLRGFGEAVVENYKGIIEYSTEKIRVNTSVGVLRLTGKDMFIKCLDADNIIITGKIMSAEFL